MATGVRIKGPFTGPSGYDHHVREFARALSRQGVSVQLTNLTEWSPVQLSYEVRDPWFESLSGPVDARTTIHFCFPTQVVPDPDHANINFTMFEATRIPPAWKAAHVNSDLIVLPTEHSRMAWIDSGVPESKLRMCPLGVRTDLYRPGVRPLQLPDASSRPLGSYAVRFLNVSELGPRKNLTGLLTAWLRATSTSDNAVLILKVGCYSPGSLASFEAEVRRAQEQAGKRLDQAAPVQFIYNLFPDADMPRLFAATTHYISVSFGEGWDLSMTEAAASGLRLIAPRHSGYVTYLDDEVATLISAKETRATTPPGTWLNQLFEGASWWAPNEDEAVQAIRRAIEGRDTPGASAQERMAEHFSWEKAAARLIEVIDEAEAMAAPPPAR